MTTPSYMLHDAVRAPHTSPEALMAETMIEKMQTVCRKLGWKTDPPDDSIYHIFLVAHVEGYPSASVSLLHGQYPHKDRITINASTPHDASIYRYGEGRLSVSVSGARPPDQIAKEIERRFLPRFSEIARKSEEIEKRNQAYKARLESCLARLKGEALDESERQNGQFLLHLEPSWGTVQYSDENEVSLDLHNVGVEKAGRILKILRQSIATQEESHVA